MKTNLIQPRGRSSFASIWHLEFGTSHSPRAFTFIEILFSIVILGVGLIMIAGMLPVAIKQNADTRNELTAKIVCDSGYAYLRTLAQNHPEAFPMTHGDNTVNGGKSIETKSNSEFDKYMSDELMNLNSTDEYTTTGGFPKTAPGRLPTDRRAGRVVPLSFDVVRPDATYNIDKMIDEHAKNPTRTAKVHPETDDYPLGFQQFTLGDRVISSEPRFQWLGFYRRDEESNVAKLIIVAMRQQSGEVDSYSANTTQQEQLDSKNGPFIVPIEIEDSLTGADKVKFTFTGANPIDVDVAESGSYLIIAHSPPLSGDQTGGDLNRPFRNNGRVFKLAARRDDLDTAAGGARVWELAPGYDLAPASEGPDGIIGTADDIPDGSMNTNASFEENKPPIAAGARTDQVTHYPVTDKASDSVAGTRTWAWLIGKGRLDPTSTAESPHVGATQDLGVLSVDLPLK